MSLDIAEERNTGQTRAYAVEQCSSLRGYTGVSCEDCAVPSAPPAMDVPVHAKYKLKYLPLMKQNLFFLLAVVQLRRSPLRPLPRRFFWPFGTESPRVAWRVSAREWHVNAILPSITMQVIDTQQQHGFTLSERYEISSRFLIRARNITTSNAPLNEQELTLSRTKLATPSRRRPNSTGLCLRNSLATRSVQCFQVFKKSTYISLTVSVFLRWRLTEVRFWSWSRNATTNIKVRWVNVSTFQRQRRHSD